MAALRYQFQSILVLFEVKVYLVDWFVEVMKKSLGCQHWLKVVCFSKLQSGQLNQVDLLHTKARCWTTESNYENLVEDYQAKLNLNGGCGTTAG